MLKFQLRESMTSWNRPPPSRREGTENDEIFKTPILIIPGIEQIEWKPLQYIYDSKNKIYIQIWS